MSNLRLKKIDKEDQFFTDEHRTNNYKILRDSSMNDFTTNLLTSAFIEL